MGSVLLLTGCVPVTFKDGRRQDWIGNGTSISHSVGQTTCQSEASTIVVGYISNGTILFIW